MPLDLTRIATGNVTLLKKLTLEEALEVHPLLNAQGFAYGKARKTKPIKAKPINAILGKGNPTVYECLLLDTLEAAQKIEPGSMICWGEAGDVWQQSHKNLHKKYEPREMDEDGFVTYFPKEGPDSVMNSFQVRHAGSHKLGAAGGWAVVNPWWGDVRFIDAEKCRETLAKFGIDMAACDVEIVEKMKDGKENKDFTEDPNRLGKAKLCLHYGVSRPEDKANETNEQQDWVLQNQGYAPDTYRVKDSFFNSTYEIEQEQGA